MHRSHPTQEAGLIPLFLEVTHCIQHGRWCGRWKEDLWGGSIKRSTSLPEGDNESPCSQARCLVTDTLVNSALRQPGSAIELSATLSFWPWWKPVLAGLHKACSRAPGPPSVLFDSFQVCRLFFFGRGRVPPLNWNGLI